MYAAYWSLGVLVFMYFWCKMLKIGRMTHRVTDGVYVFQIGPTSSEWLIYTPEPVPRIRVNRLELDVWSWKRGNWTTPHASLLWTKDTRMCNPKEIMRTHAHSQLVIMRTHAVQGAMLPMELRKWLEGQIRLYTTAISWMIWKQMVANWSMSDFQPLSFDTMHTKTITYK